ncbi:ATP-binding protein [Nocardiopsis mwathae]|nr:ATP-binding protein [Nocardiopsis mwathae]
MAFYTRSFPGVPEQVAEARHWAEDVLTTAVHGPGTPDETTATAVLLLSELCTNAIRHTHTGRQGGRFTVSLVLTPGQLEARVADNGAADSAPRLLSTGPDAEQGRGLHLVRHFADHTGPLPQGCGVFFRLAWATTSSAPTPARAGVKGEDR